MTSGQPDRPSLKTTRDGSHTLYSDRFHQHYHNPNGAVSESLHVFFEATGLPEHLRSGRPAHILEIGFGTGLNLLLLMDLLHDLPNPPEVVYQTVEAYPISAETARQFNYGQQLRHPGTADILPGIFDSLQPGQNTFLPAKTLEVRVFKGFFDTFAQPFDAHFIFHDAFSPEVNAELWDAAMFQQLKALSRDTVKMGTYCAASKARAAMAWAGWKVARAPGALGKREMTLAALDARKLGDLKRVNEERLARRYEEGDFD